MWAICELKALQHGAMYREGGRTARKDVQGSMTVLDGMALSRGRIARMYKGKSYSSMFHDG